jgi:hypothetical protein
MKKIQPTNQPKPPGRPTKRTDQTLRILFEAAATGAPIKSCCAVAGIHPDTWQEWRERDPDLQARFDESRERGRVAVLAVLQKEASKDWRAGAEWLRLAHRAEYSAKAEITLEAGECTQAIAITPAGLLALQSGYKEFRRGLAGGGE